MKSIKPRLLAYLDTCKLFHEGKVAVSALAVRPCGDCTFCCTAPVIEEAQILPEEREKFHPKPAGETCKHCKGGCCEVYDTRPDICHGYLCLYVCGLTDINPMQGKVCWTFQPRFGTSYTMVVGHALDADEVMRDVDNRAAMREFLTFTEFRVSGVVLRTPKECVYFDNTGDLPNLMADVNPVDPLKMEVLESTQRRARWTLCSLTTDPHL